MTTRSQATSGAIECELHTLRQDVRLWRVDLDSYPRVDVCDGLSDGEIARAVRLVSSLDRRRYLAAHHVLRHVLASVVARPAGTLMFETDVFGKPHLRDAGSLEFSLSHSEHECLIAVSPGEVVGVDVEVIRPVPDACALARRHFTASECSEWKSVEDSSRIRAFLACWTRKEACLKALGVGVAAPPASVEVGCAEDFRATVVSIGANRCEVEVCTLHLPGEAVGAIAITTPEDAAIARSVFAQR